LLSTLAESSSKSAESKSFALTVFKCSDRLRPEVSLVPDCGASGNRKRQEHRGRRQVDAA
jgi:hypothetical protein